MAVPGKMMAATHSRATSAASMLFERLPDRLFGPLASLNRHRYWALLCDLHSTRFGPEAPLPPSNGFSVKDITQDIVDELLTQDRWESEEGQTPETPIGIRANMVLTRLIDSGWFRLETFGLEKRVTMRPPVSKFLTFMMAFAETGPVFVSGKIRSIELNIQEVVEGKAAGDTLAETAEQARNLLEHVRNTGTNVRDIMEALSKETATSQYVRLFFSQYIEQVFIGDYRELRTKEHPLSRRPQIIRAVEELQESEHHRERLISWYQTKRGAGDRRRAELLFEKDIRRLFDLRRIDEYLERLDDEIRLANRRAQAYLDYRLRSLRPVDHMIKHVLEVLATGQHPLMGDPFPATGLMSEEGLAEPRKPIERPAPSSLRRHAPSEDELARSRVMLRARDARTITPPKLAEYVRRQIGAQGRATHEALQLDSVSDVRSCQILATLGMAMSAGSRRLLLSAMTVARGFRVTQGENIEVEGKGISGRPFTIESTHAPAGTSESSS